MPQGRGESAMDLLVFFYPFRTPAKMFHCNRVFCPWMAVICNLLKKVKRFSLFVGDTDGLWPFRPRSGRTPCDVFSNVKGTVHHGKLTHGTTILFQEAISQRSIRNTFQKTIKKMAHLAGLPAEFGEMIFRPYGKRMSYKHKEKSIECTLNIKKMTLFPAMMDRLTKDCRSLSRHRLECISYQRMEVEDALI
ncbi:hypothetical protein JTE90_003989 [Oedothorax gibbosus]|uniref:Uncharacterized protein n=1 Tax=Oedothorax gibbosus TaxID=931172 RepID=A0AAV6UBD3_9ARAC|nr:hypothetical protein JTE90_003989 [Oedothorax gibbosus]